jgi:hypothetical protein
VLSIATLATSRSRKFRKVLGSNLRRSLLRHRYEVSVSLTYTSYMYLLPRALALCVEPIVVQQDLIELFQDLDAWRIRLNKLLLLTFRYLIELVLYVVEEIGKTACFTCQSLVLSRTVAACVSISITRSLRSCQITDSSCIPSLLVRTP